MWKFLSFTIRFMWVLTLVTDICFGEMTLAVKDFPFGPVEERFGVSVHRRSIERALARQEKKRR